MSHTITVQVRVGRELLPLGTVSVPRDPEDAERSARAIAVALRATADRIDFWRLTAGIEGAA